MKAKAGLWIGIATLILLSPLGLIVPAKLGAGSAWGEWSIREINKLVGYAPAGMSKLSKLWKSPLPDYAFRGQESASVHALSLSYIISGILGVIAVSVLTLLIGKVLACRDKPDAS